MDPATSPITPLRQRMLDDMRMRQLAPKTQSHYIRAVRQFAAFLGRSPDTADIEDLRRYQLHLVDHGISPVSLNAAITGLKFFFDVTLDRPELMAKMQPVLLERLRVWWRVARAQGKMLDGGWLEARQAELLPVAYYHVVFTLPAPIGAIAYYNKAVVYGLLFDVAAETLRTIAADPRHLGAQIGVTLVLHTWGSALTHHPHVHGIVPGGGLSLDGARWVACKPGFFLPVRVLSRLFRRRFLEELDNAHRAGRLQFFGEYAALSERQAFADWLAPLRHSEWVVYAKRPFAGPEAVLAYLARYTHRVAISNSRLVAMDEHGVTFRWKDYRAKGRTRYKTMTLEAHEFMRRFLLHVLPHGFHRIRHYGLIANAGRKANLAKARELLQVVSDLPPPEAAAPAIAGPTFVCPHCGAAMRIIDTFARGQPIRAPPWQQGAV